MSLTQLSHVVSDKRDPQDIPDSELVLMLATLRREKFWSEPYFSLDTEQQRRAVRKWRHQDIFGQGQP